MINLTRTNVSGLVLLYLFTNCLGVVCRQSLEYLEAVRSKVGCSEVGVARENDTRHRGMKMLLIRFLFRLL